MDSAKTVNSLVMVCIFALIFSSYAFSETVSGVVYHDINRNGTMESMEKGINNVAVSNGHDVVLTNSKGRYQIDINDNDILFISKPSGYALELDDNNIPEFFYIHSPDGTPEDVKLRYPGLSASGKISSDINFPLYKYKEPDEYDVLLLSDPQTGTNEELDYFRDQVAAELAGTKAAFGITTGDIVHDDLSLYSRYMELVAQAGIPWFNVPGNHDINYLAPDDAQSLDTFKRHFGPSYYSFNWGKAHYIMLDTVYYNGTDPEKRNGSGGYSAKLDERQMNWLKEDLSVVPKNRLIVLSMHIPINTVDAGTYGGALENKKELLGLLTGFDNIFAIAGHLHATQHVYLGSNAGYTGKKPLHQHIITTASGSWWNGAKDIAGIPHTTQMDGTPNGYHIMHVKGNRYTVSYKAAGKPDKCQMRIMIEKQGGKKLASTIPLSAVRDFQIVVNLFDGGENSRVSCRIDNGESFSLRPDTRIDTFTFRSYEKDNSFISGRELPSSHIWSGSFSEYIKPGVHKITVLAVDEYGVTHSGIKIFEVAEDNIRQEQ